MPKVALLYLIWSNEPQKYLVEALSGIMKQNYPKQDIELLIVYNSHKPEEESSLGFIQNEIEKIKNFLPHTTILNQEKNLGFTGGNNVGVSWAIDNGFDYVFLHNADGYLAENAISELVKAMEGDKNIGQSQSLILLHPENNLINSAGNKWQYLGIGYCDYFRVDVSTQDFSEVKEIDYVSGAATMLRTDLLKEYDGLNPNFFLYHEDTEYSWRLKIRGFKTIMASKSIFYHKYEFTKNLKKFYWMERNRQAVKLLIYKWRTLILLLPLEFFYHLGLMAVALKGGWAGELLNVYKYWISPNNWKIWLSERKKYQSERILNDAQILEIASPIVASGDLVVSSKINNLANAIFIIYYKFIKLIVNW